MYAMSWGNWFMNFRMRAMVVSFACFGLHLSWRTIHAPLARLFLDYEPGIHLSQLQMQAGITGINAGSGLQSLQAVFGS